MMMGKPCYLFAEAFYAINGVNESVGCLDVLDTCERVCNGMDVDMEAVYRFVHYLRKEFYSFGRAVYHTWHDEDQSLRKAAVSIDFFEIRLPGGLGRVYREDTPGRLSLATPLYERYQSFLKPGRGNSLDCEVKIVQTK